MTIPERTTLTIYRGLPACGKSTDAKLRRAAAEAAGRQAVIVERDDISRALHGGRWRGDPPARARVSAAQYATITAQLLLGVDVYCSDTNLDDGHVAELCGIAAGLDAHVEIVDMRDVDLELCLTRNRLRPGDDRLDDDKIVAMHVRHIAPLVAA